MFYSSNSFEAFLRDCLDHGHTQVKLVPRYVEDGSVAFYAVGQCGPQSGETFDAVVVNDEIINMTQPERDLTDEETAIVAVEEGFTEEELAALPEPQADG